jgi:hypothetical protein
MKISVAIGLVIGLKFFENIEGHMLMSFPLPRGYKGNQAYGDIDYNLNAPMSSTAMCKGKQAGPITYTAHAGETIEVQFDGSARHGGVKYKLSRLVFQIFRVSANLHCPTILIVHSL